MLQVNNDTTLLCILICQLIITDEFIAHFFVDRVTEVKTDIYVTSFGPVSDADMVKYSSLPVITCFVLI